MRYNGKLPAKRKNRVFVLTYFSARKLLVKNKEHANRNV